MGVLRKDEPGAYTAYQHGQVCALKGLKFNLMEFGDDYRQGLYEEGFNREVEDTYEVVLAMTTAKT